MRSNVVFFVLVALAALLAGTLVTRAREPHAAPFAAPSASVAPAAPASGTPPGSATALSSALPVTPSQPKPKLGRTLRVVGLGWDAIAAGVLANGGLEPADKGEFGPQGLKVALDAVDSPNKIEKALARGGSDEHGADIAILPLPTVVAGWERLRALNLAAFYVVAWSRGRDVLVSKKKSFSELPALGPIEISGTPGDASTFLALHVLEIAGIAPARVSLDGKSSSALITARSRGSDKSEDKKTADLLLSTSDASRLVPWVAVAQRSLVSGQPDVLIAWAKGWNLGQIELDKDAASAARTIGNLDGAPEPLALLERLGELAQVSLTENTELFALSGRGAITIDALFDRCWQVWRQAKLLTTPPPERAPVNDLIVAGLARAEPKLLKNPSSTSDAPKGKGAGARLLIARSLSGAKLDDEIIVTEIGMLGGGFHRSPLRLTVHGASARKTEEIVQLAADRYGLEAHRITIGKAQAKPNTMATIEILEPR
jgi:hypothetical protein